ANIILGTSYFFFTSFFEYMILEPLQRLKYHIFKFASFSFLWKFDTQTGQCCPLTFFKKCGRDIEQTRNGNELGLSHIFFILRQPFFELPSRVFPPAGFPI
ncbi:MAG: hypothetical protein II969_10320, partial [Anaerolineaceae bacterium]|nr:hypothetical protein [Anaerolineaceae bacterium]